MPRAQGLTKKTMLDPDLGCAVVGKSTTDDKVGNYWCCHDVVACKVGIAPHPSRKHDMAVLTKAATLTEALRHASEEDLFQGPQEDESDED